MRAHQSDCGHILGATKLFSPGTAPNLSVERQTTFNCFPVAEQNLLHEKGPKGDTAKEGQQGKGACPERRNMLKWLLRPSQHQPAGASKLGSASGYSGGTVGGFLGGSYDIDE